MTEQLKINVPLNQLKVQECKCGSTSFLPATQLRILPPLYSAIGKYEYVMLQTGFLCASCGAAVAMRPEEPESKIITFPGKKEEVPNNVG